MDSIRIQEMLEAPELETRVFAAQQLVAASDPPLEAVRRALEDEALRVREYAIEAAARSLPAGELVGLMGNHQNAILRNAAIEALKMAGERGASALVAALAHSDLEVVMFSAQILGDIK